jgi:small subunit ribosomal protein S13
MARIAGVDLPPQKRTEVGLTYIYGIGRARAAKVLAEANVDVNRKIRDLSEEEVNRIRTVLDAQGNIEGDLRKQIQLDIKR